MEAENTCEMYVHVHVHVCTTRLSIIYTYTCICICAAPLDHALLLVGREVLEVLRHLQLLR